MEPLRKGRYLARLADTPQDLRAAQRLRWLRFVARNGVSDDGARVDADRLDAECQHMLVEDFPTGHLVCCFRVLPLAAGPDIARSYSAQFYDLRALHAFDGPMLEVGRFCVHPAVRDPDIVRTAWAALTRLVEDTGTRMLFGCSSFVGTEPGPHAEAFAILRARHLAPRRWWPRIKAPDVFRFARALLPGQPDPKRAMAAMPPLLRSYLALGGWVSDHAVVDPVLRTMHVFTGVEIAAIPQTRQRLLRAAAGPS
ncbi:GNAT family N-acetyltransferase [Paracoccus sediminis]|uniref:L-ornithine N(alpha)-acyltransferase n=1 Tax=Paracoccus sediminis TaxID=1214787 RepID=A0A238VLV3_9RHOB|nr:GNAT family N-acetyltransferase [Paracoccus sediminis]TBN52277.1 GNAT family N-acetyltransferase [Paracoccus sediminis]SNR35178.1 ornithine-acyl[acyl carrier protein] N-acyltransferase [Paracoccus sediminis]